MYYFFYIELGDKKKQEKKEGNQHSESACFSSDISTPKTWPML